MRSGRLRSMRREETRPAAGFGGRACAERLWQETVARPCAPESDVARPCAPTDDNSGSNVPRLTPALSEVIRNPQTPGARSARLASRHSARGAVAPFGPVGPGRRRGNADGAALSPSPPVGEERAGVRRGPVTSGASRQPADRALNLSPLPAGPAMRKLRALWHSAYHLGLIHDRSDEALGAWLRRLARLDEDACTAPAPLDRPIQALKAWLARAAGVDWRPHLSLGQDGRVWERRRPRARVLEAQWRLLYRRGRVRIGSLAALGAYAARHAGLGRAESHLALSNAQADALIRHLGKSIRAASKLHD